MFLAIYVWNLKMFDLWRCKNLHTQVKMRMEILSLDVMADYFTNTFADSLPTVTK